MSKHYTRKYSCTGKQQYETWLLARQGAKAMIKVLRECLRPYRCRYCRWWHVGHQPEMKK